MNIRKYVERLDIEWLFEISVSSSVSTTERRQQNSL